jgi:NAD(P)-dependent dehydrogenase (short-subunit alcohol dehydrogenase family)
VPYCDAALVNATTAASARETEWVLTTSGTTGAPKLVAHTLRGLVGAIAPPDRGAQPSVWATFYDIRRYGGGHIVNISSIVASTGYSGVSAYAATKAAMIGLTKSLAREVGRLGITVNAVAPGFLETELTADMTDEQRERVARRSALQRLADTTDVAEAVAFLVSEKGRNITGTVLTVDAGSTA